MNINVFIHATLLFWYTNLFIKEQWQTCLILGEQWTYKFVVRSNVIYVAVFIIIYLYYSIYKAEVIIWTYSLISGTTSQIRKFYFIRLKLTWNFITYSWHLFVRNKFAWKLLCFSIWIRETFLYHLVSHNSLLAGTCAF